MATGRSFGYVRVGRIVPDAVTQAELLTDAGCTSIFKDDPPARFDQRRELRQMLDGLVRGDIVTVAGLHVIGRNVDFLIDTVLEIDAKAVRFRSLTDEIDTGVSKGRPGLPAVLRLLKNFEHDLAAEAARGKLPESRAPKRPSKVIDDDTVGLIRRLYFSTDLPIADVARQSGVSESSVYRALPPDQRRQSRD